MPRKVKPVPTGYRTVTPYLVVRGADEAIAYYEKAFGAKTLSRYTDETGLHVLQAEIKIGNAIVLLCEEVAEYGILSPVALGGTAVALHVYLSDPDAAMTAAIEAGAHALVEMRDTPHGERFGKIADPFGHVWTLAMRIALPASEPTPKAIAEKAAAIEPQVEVVAPFEAMPASEPEAVAVLEPSEDIREAPVA